MPAGENVSLRHRQNGEGERRVTHKNEGRQIALPPSVELRKPLRQVSHFKFVIA